MTSASVAARTIQERAAGHAAGPAAAVRAAAGRWRRALALRPVPEGIRITRIGLAYLMLAMLVAAAGANTGNNALYMVLAAMLALLVVSGLASRANLRRLAIELDLPGELFAKRPALAGFTVHHRGRWLPRWLLLLTVDGGGRARLVPYLAPGGQARGQLELLFARRGRHRVAAAHVASIFPLGLFRKGLRYPLDREVLVYPELFPAGGVELERGGLAGEESSRRAGWGHELHALRAFRAGDDPRSIHWKQTARLGSLVFTEREAEETLRLSILLDNGLGSAPEASRAAHFEVLVSEAATAAVEHLARGFDVELVTRDRFVPFSGGARQRRTLLETLALLATVPPGRGDLVASDPSARQLRLGAGGAPR